MRQQRLYGILNPASYQNNGKPIRTELEGFCGVANSHAE